MSVIDEVKQKTDIIEVISQYATLTKAGRNFKALCPFHSEKTPSFFVFPEQQSWHCFGACNTGGDVFSFIMKQQSTDFGETLRLLAQRAGVVIPSRPEQDTRKDAREKLYQINEAATQYFHNLLINSAAGEKARNYLSHRGISSKTISDFQLGFSLNNWEGLKQYLLERGYTESELLEAGLIAATDEGKTHDRFRDRLLFPIKDSSGHIIGFGGRVLDESFPKYLNSPQTPVFDKSGSLYGINLATPVIRQQSLAVIVEGYMDVITAHQNGFTNVVAAMGTSVTEKQINILKRLTRNMVLALDADAAGEEAMLRCVGYENSLDAEVKVIVLPGGKDPDDVIKEDTKTWQNLLEEALPVVDYTFNMVTAQLDLTTAKDKRFLVERLGSIILEVKDTVRKAHYVQKLARLAEITERTLEATLNGLKSNRRVNRPKIGVMTNAVKPLYTSPLEESCLRLLLQHHELKDRSDDLLPEYFENSENLEIFTAWQETGNLSSLKNKLDSTIWEHLDDLINKNVPTNQIERRYTDYVLNLRKKYFRNLEMKRAEYFAMEVEAGGAGADLTRLEKEGIEPSIKLREIFTQKLRRGQ